MSRKKVVRKVRTSPDVVFGSILASKMINRLMQDGKKSLSEKIFYESIKKAGKKIKDDATKLLEQNKEAISWIGEEVSKETDFELFRLAIAKIGPEIEVKSRRVGGATYQVPIEVSDKRRKSLAIRWLVTYARQRAEHTMVDRLSGEIVDACRGTGGALKKREDVFRMAESNKAFAHYKW